MKFDCYDAENSCQTAVVEQEIETILGDYRTTERKMIICADGHAAFDQSVFFKVTEVRRDHCLVVVFKKIIECRHVQRGRVRVCGSHENGALDVSINFHKRFFGKVPRMMARWREFYIAATQ